jgi:hypothetical protein
MIVRVERLPADGESLPGDLYVNDRKFCACLERTSKRIPLGVFAMLFTVSARAAKGELWTPDPQYRLPEIIVPDHHLITEDPRVGIRVHAANRAMQLLGCVATGTRNGAGLIDSRAALEAFVALVAAASLAKEPMTMEVANVAEPVRIA